MTTEDIIDALAPLFILLVPNAKVSDDQWEQYTLALSDLNPGDLDDAIADLRKTYTFRNLPLPADIRTRADKARRHRIAQLAEDRPHEPILKGEGELHEFTLPGIGSMKIRVLPDDHPALKRFACLRCHDTGWAEHHEKTPMGNTQYEKCHCASHNPEIQKGRERRAEYVKNKMERT